MIQQARTRRVALLISVVAILALSLFGSAHARVGTGPVATNPAVEAAKKSNKFEFDVTSVRIRTGTVGTVSCIGFPDGPLAARDLLETVACDTDRSEFALVKHDESRWQILVNDDGEDNLCLAVVGSTVEAVECSTASGAQLFKIEESKGVFTIKPDLNTKLCLQWRTTAVDTVQVATCSKTSTAQRFRIEGQLANLEPAKDLLFQLIAASGNALTTPGGNDGATPLITADGTFQTVPNVFRLRRVDGDNDGSDSDEDDRSSTVRGSEEGPYYQLVSGNLCITISTAANNVDLTQANCNKRDPKQHFGAVRQPAAGPLSAYIISRATKSCIVEVGGAVVEQPCDFNLRVDQIWTISLLDATIA